jgi:hypothetical protein
MTTIDLYKKHKAGEVSREKFLYEVRRDAQLPWIISVTSYDDAIKILKNKGIIRESYDNQVGQSFNLDVKSERGDGSVQNYQLKNVKLVNANGRIFEKPDGTTVTLAPSDKYTSTKVENVEEIKTEEAPMEEMSHKDAPMDEKLNPMSDEDIEIYVDELGEDVDKKVLGKFFAENNLYEREEDALLKHYGFYNNVDNVMDVLRYKDQYKSRRRAFAEDLQEAKKKQPKTIDADHANPYQYRLGIQYELECSDDYTDEGLDKAKAKTLRNLAKDSNYYTTLLNADKSHYTFKATETDKPGMQAKADGYLKKELVKNAKANVKDNLGKKEQGTASPKGVKEMTMTPKKAKGISKVMDVPGKPKVVKEGVSFKDFFLTENEEVEVDKKAKSIAKIKAKLKKETKLIKSKTTGTTIDVVPDNQVPDIQASLAKKGVQITTTDV